MSIQPYVFFDGRCEEAVEYYRQTLGAEVTMLMRYKDNPDLSASSEQCTAGSISPEKVMHMQLRLGGSTILASDGMCGGNPKFEGFSLSYTVGSVPEAEKYFSALATEGQVQMPLAKTFFSPMFGMVIDKFGVCWIIYAEPKA